MEVEAKARYMRIPPRKARLVANTVIGMPVKDALVVLQFTHKAAAKEVAKVVKSAAANASNNFSQDEDALIVKSIIVNEGPTIKRGRPRARGMYFSIFKRTCHITAVVDTEVPVVRPSRRRKPAEAADAVEKPRRAEKSEAKTEKPAKAEEASKAEVVEEKPEEKALEPEPEKKAEAETVAEEARADEAETEAVEAGPKTGADEAEQPGAEKAEEEKPPAEKDEKENS